MRKGFLLFSFLALFQAGFAQKQTAQLGENSIVKDSLGTEYPYAVWSQLMMSGRYNLRPEHPQKENTAFIITRMSEEEYESRMASMPKPGESPYFRTGSKFSHFKKEDITGRLIDTRKFLGRIVVLNFWFINCPPCRMEMPELHKLTETYKEDSSIVFIAVALDQKDDLLEFLKTHPFGYTIIGDGRYLVQQYNNLGSFPTNVVVDQDGKVYFHSTGLSTNTIYWLRKSIETLKQHRKTALR